MEKPHKGIFEGTTLRQKVWALAGFAAFGLGCAGAVLPLLPTVPFILLAALCFARSSERLERWFKATKLYQTVIEGFATKRTMTLKAKLCMLLPVTALLALSFILMANVPIGRIVVAVIWLGHVAYFGFMVPLDRGDKGRTEPVREELAAPAE